MTLKSDAKRRAHHKGAGLCMQCSAPSPVAYYCRVCATAHNARKVARDAARTARGQCHDCQAFATPGITLCAYHARAKAVIMAQVTGRKRVTATCEKCQFPADGKSIYCKVHKRADNARCRLRYHALIDAGLCPRCGARPLATRKYCRECAERRAACERQRKAAQ